MTMKPIPVARTASIIRTARVPMMHHAFTLIELLVVIAIIGILAALTMPVLSRAMNKSRQIHCLNQLHQVGIASIAFGQDHNDRLPTQLWTNGCSAAHSFHETIAPGALVRSYCAFLAMSNELANPRILACRADQRAPAPDFRSLRGENVSYAVGLQATLNRPDSILALDANLVHRGTMAKLDLTQGGIYNLAWTKRVHGSKGNLLFADAHVELKRSIRWTVPPVVQPEPETNAPSQELSVARTQPASKKDAPAAVQTAWENFTNGMRTLLPTITFQPQEPVASAGQTASAPAKQSPSATPETKPSREAAGSEKQSQTGSSMGDGGNSEDNDEGNNRLLYSIGELILLLLLIWLLSLAATYGFKYWRARRI